jgi:hypothetical protein
MPDEDYFTTAFSFLLRQDKELARSLVKKILERTSKKPLTDKELMSSGLKIRTQETQVVAGRKADRMKQYSNCVV